MPVIWDYSRENPCLRFHDDDSGDLLLIATITDNHDVDLEFVENTELNFNDIMNLIEFITKFGVISTNDLFDIAAKYHK